MKSRLEEDLKLEDMEVLIQDKFLVDAFKPKICHEKDVLVIAFLVKNRNAAEELGRLINQCPISVMNIEVSSSPDPEGNFIVLGEFDRDREAFAVIDRLLEYLNRQVHVNKWYFKPEASEQFIPWNEDNFRREVAQEPTAFLSRNEDRSTPVRPNAVQSDSDENDSQAAEKPLPEIPSQEPEIDYELMAKLIDKQVAKSSRSHMRAFKKQIKKIIEDSQHLLKQVADTKSDSQYLLEQLEIDQIKKMIKDNQRLLKQYADSKSDSQYFFKQLEMNQRREKLALMRERQDIKRIRDLEDRLSYLMLTHTSSREIQVTDNTPSTIPVGGATVSENPKASADPEDYYDAEQATVVQPSTAVADERMTEGVSDAGEFNQPQQADIQTPSNKASGASQDFEPAGTETVILLDEVVDEAEIAGADQEAAQADSTAGHVDLQTGQAPLPGSEKTESDIGDDPIAGENQTEGEDLVTEKDGPAADSVTRLFGLAAEASEKKEYHKAIEYFTRITELSPDEPRIYYNLAILYYRLKDYDTAHEYASIAHDLGSKGAGQIVNKVETKKLNVDDAPGKDSESVKPSTATGSFSVDSPAAEKGLYESSDESIFEAAPAATADSGETPREFPQSVTADPIESVMEPQLIGDRDHADAEPAPNTDVHAGALDDNDTIMIDSRAFGTIELTDFAVSDPKEISSEETETASPDTEIPDADEPGTEQDQAAADFSTDDAPLSDAPKTQIEAEPETEDTEVIDMSEVLPAAGKIGSDIHGLKQDEDRPDEITAETGDVNVQADADTAVTHSVVPEKSPGSAATLSEVLNSVEVGQMGDVFDNDTTPFDLSAIEPEPDPTADVAPVKDSEALEGQRATEEAAVSDQKNIETKPSLQADNSEVNSGRFPEIIEHMGAFDNSDTIMIDSRAFDAIAPFDIDTSEKETEQKIPAVVAADEEDVSEPLDTVRDGQDAESPTSIEEHEIEPGAVASHQTEPVVDSVRPDQAESVIELETEPEVEPESVPEQTGTARESVSVATGADENEPAPAEAGNETDTIQEKIETLTDLVDPQEAKIEKTPPKAEAPVVDDSVFTPVSKIEHTTDFFKLGKEASGRKDYGLAIAYFSNYVELNPDESRGYSELAVLDLRLKKYEAARENAERAEALGSKVAGEILRKIDRKLAAAKPLPPTPAPARPEAEKVADEAELMKTTAASSPERAETTVDTVVLPTATPPLENGIATTQKAEKPEPEQEEVDKRKTEPSGTDPKQESEVELEAPDSDTAPEPDQAEAAASDDTSDQTESVIELEAGLEAEPESESEQDGTAREPVSVATGADEIEPVPAEAGNATDTIPGKIETLTDLADPQETKSEKTPPKAEAPPVDILSTTAVSRFEPSTDFFSLGKAAFDRKDYGLAITYFRQFLESAPDEPRGHYNLAILNYRLRNYDDAQEHAERARELGSKKVWKISRKIDAKLSIREQETKKRVQASAVDEDLRVTSTISDADDDQDKSESGTPAGHTALMVDTVPGTAGTAAEPEAAVATEPAAVETEVPEDAEVGDADQDTEENLFESPDTGTGPEDTKPSTSVDADQSDIAKAATKPPDKTDMPASELSVETPFNKLTPSKKEPGKDETAKVSGSDPSTETLPPEAAEKGLADVSAIAPENILADTKDYFALCMSAVKKKDYGLAIAHLTRFVDVNPDEPRGYYNLAVLHYRLKDYNSAQEYAERARELGSAAAGKILKKTAEKLSTESPGRQQGEQLTKAGDGLDEPTHFDMEVVEYAADIESHIEPAPSDVTDTPAERQVEQGGEDKVSALKVDSKSKTAGTAAVPEAEEATEPAVETELPQEAGTGNEDQETEENLFDLPDTATGSENTKPSTSVDADQADTAKAATETPERTDTSVSELSVETPFNKLTPSKRRSGKAETAKVSERQDSSVDTLPSEAAEKGLADVAAKAPEKIPADTKDYFALGMAAVKKKDYGLAISHLTRFVDVNPDEPRGYYNLSILYYRLKDYNSAQEHAERARKLGSAAAGKILKKTAEKLSTESSGRQQGEQLTKAGDGSDEPTHFDMEGIEYAADIESYIEPASFDDTDTPAERHVEQGGEDKVAALKVDSKSKTDGTAAESEAAVAAEPAVETEVPEDAGVGDEDQETEENLFESPDTDTGPKDVKPSTSVDADQADTAKAATETPERTDTSSSELSVETPFNKLAPSKKEPRKAETAKVSGSDPSAETLPSEAAEKGLADVSVIAPEKKPADAKDYFELGMAASNKKDNEQAIAHFTRFIELAPDESRGYYNLSILYYRLKDYDAAEKNGKRALEMGAKPAKRILDKVKKKRRAATKTGGPKAISGAVDDRQQPETDTDSFGPSEGTALSAPDKGVSGVKPFSTEPIGDIDNLETADTATVDTTAMGKDNMVVWGADDLVEEVNVSEEPAADANAVGPGQNDVIVFDQQGRSGVDPSSGDNDPVSKFYSLGLAASKKGDYLKAIQHFTKVTHLSPEDPRGYYNLAIVSYRLKFYESAKEHARRAIALGLKSAKQIVEKIEAQQAAA